MDTSSLSSKDLLIPYDSDLLLDLSKEQIEAAYRHQLLKYTAMDAKLQLEYCFDLDNDEIAIFSDTELLLIAERFLNDYDCNSDDNTAWYSLLRDELTRLLNELNADDNERAQKLLSTLREALETF
ncbi:hypothetical protein V3M52_01035 [Trueperella pyogenes]|uniref:hypothetical protein n=1 Tax=Trueperella pyogenes TaxID=1661 RepID=UPI00345DCA44